MATNVLAGRKWKRARDRKNTITVKYRVELASALAIGSEGGNLTGVPKPGDQHPNDDNLEVASVDYEEESGSGLAKFVIATVNYEAKNSASETTIQEEGGVKYQVDEWGWDAGTDEKELIDDIRSTETNPKPVLNSAGDPFDAVPKVSVYAPVFTKVMKFGSRRSGATAFSCKVNSEEITIGGRTCAPGTLLCIVSEKRIFGDPDWNYAYTVQLKYKSNKVKLHGDSETSELGWDVGIADAGMRQKDPDDQTKKKLIRMIDQETGQECVVQSPALLDGNGYVISPTDPDQGPRVLRFQAYERTSFPSWFYSEPVIVTPPEPEPEPEA